MKNLHFLIAFAVYVAATHASDICSTSTCYTSDASECDRTSEKCPVCLEEDDSTGEVSCVDPFIGICPFGTTKCKTVTSPSRSPSPKPTPKPSPTKESSASSSGSSSESSGSGSESTTPKPTTKKPEPTPSPAPFPTLENTPGSQEPSQKDKDQTSSAPVSSGNEKKSSGPNIGLILGIVAAIVVVIGAVGFILWKQKNEDDDSDDEEEYHPTYRPPVAARAPAPAPALAPVPSRTMNAPYGSNNGYGGDNSYGGNNMNNYNAPQTRSSYGYVPPAPVDYQGTKGRQSALMRSQENSSDMPPPGRYTQPDALESGLGSHESAEHDIWGNVMESTHRDTKNNNNEEPIGRSDSSASVEF